MNKHDAMTICRPFFQPIKPQSIVLQLASSALRKRDTLREELHILHSRTPYRYSVEGHGEGSSLCSRQGVSPLPRLKIYEVRAVFLH